MVRSSEPTSRLPPRLSTTCAAAGCAFTCGHDGPRSDTDDGGGLRQSCAPSRSFREAAVSLKKSWGSPPQRGMHFPARPDPTRRAPEEEWWSAPTSMATPASTIESAWHEAARAGDLFLLKQHHDRANDAPALVASVCPTSQRSACHQLAADGHSTALDWLLSLPHGGGGGSSVASIHDASGATPLHLAAANGHAACVMALLEHGVDDSVVRDAAGRTPFCRSAMGAHADAARVLRDASSTSVPHAFLQLSISGRGRAGELIFALDEGAAPRACANFLGLCDGFRARTRVPGALYGRDGAIAPQSSTFCGYRGTTFHRLLPGQLVQGGRLASGDTTIFGSAHFGDEREALVAAQDARGCLCMANSGPDSNASQFYVTLAPCPHLSGSHVRFGRLVSGEAVLAAMERVPCAAGSEAPSAAITITACGRWPPSSPVAASGASRVEAVASLSEVDAAAESKRAAVAATVATVLQQDRAVATGKRGREPDGVEQDQGTRHCQSVALPPTRMARWDALGGLSSLVGSEGDESDHESDDARWEDEES